jgi:hypothetical protein
VALPDLPQGYRIVHESDALIELYAPDGTRVGWAMREPSGRWLCVSDDGGRERTAADLPAAGQALLGFASQDS